MANVKILFVCLGNICRSPTAEGAFRALIEARGLESDFEVDSAGTSGWHQGEPPDPRSRAEALRRGIDIGGQRSRAVVQADFQRFDYIVAMDRANLRELRKVCPAGARARLHLLTDFANGHAEDGVPDPYYGGPDGFARVFDLIAAGAEGLLEMIAREHKLE